MSSLLENLNKEQLEAVRQLLAGPLLIVCRGGDREDNGGDRRIAYLIEQS